LKFFTKAFEECLDFSKSNDKMVSLKAESSFVVGNASIGLLVRRFLRNRLSGAFSMALRRQPRKRTGK